MNKAFFLFKNEKIFYFCFASFHLEAKGIDAPDSDMTKKAY
jgi:hypothetical protein